MLKLRGNEIDNGAGDAAFRVIELAFVAWAVGLLVFGVRELYRR